MARDAEKLDAQAARIRQLRKFARVSQETAATAVGVTLRGYQRWERGEGEVNGENLKKLAKYFGTTPDYIEYGVMERTRADTPDPFPEGQLDRIEELLAGLAERLGRLEREPEPPAQSAEEMLEVLRAATRAAEELLGQQERRASKQGQRSRSAKDRRPPSPPTAA